MLADRAASEQFNPRQARRVCRGRRPPAAVLTMLPETKLDALLARHAAIEAELAGQLSPDNYVRLSREFAELGPVADKVKAYRSVAAELADLNGLISDSSVDS